MRIVKTLALILLLLLLAGTAVVVVAPATVVQPMLGYYLSSAGYKLTELSGLSISQNQAVISRLALRNPTMELTATDTELDYSLPDLVNGKLRAVAISSLVIELLPEPAHTSSDELVEPVSLNEQIGTVLQTLNRLPLANLRIDAIDVHSNDARFDVALDVDTQPLQITGTMTSSQFPDLLLEINAGTETDSGAISGVLKVLQNAQSIVESTFAATTADESLQFQSDSTFDLAAWQMLVGATSPTATYTTPTGTASLALQFTAEGLSSSPVVTELSITLDSPQHSLQLSQVLETRQTELQLQLPLHLTGSMSAPEQQLQLFADDLRANLAVTDDTMAQQFALTGTGNIGYADDAVQGTLNLSLANQLQAVVTGEYQTVDRTGQLRWELPTYYFSKITPLSALINTQQMDMDIDIVAGSITGSGTIDISADAQGNLQFAGPLSVSVDEVSGFVGDTFFVGLSTDILAAVSKDGVIQSTGLHSASIATLDVGLPLTDIYWDYSFDSATQIVGLQNLVINTLGGEVTVADFSYDIQNPDSELTVVVTNLNLQSIVDLAEYPGLKVEGLISGYLPINLKDQTLTVEEGLIGALRPGGTIRYTSDSPVSSGNDTLKLVNEALANYHYQIMNTFVHYNADGDLRLEVQLLGNNPDMNNGQAVNLNVNIEDNIPTLLRSLQASRRITDALEQRLQERRQSGTRQGL